MFAQETAWILIILALAALAALSFLFRWRKQKGHFLPQVRFSDDDFRPKGSSEWPEYLKQVILPMVGIAVVVAVIYLSYIYSQINPVGA